jgi:hypothetical protein
MERDRKFGNIPEWAKKGPINLNNYDLRAEMHGIMKEWGEHWPFLSHDDQCPPTADEGEWDRYFRDHLGGFPPTFRMYRDGAVRYLNMPEADPQDFDTSYRPRVIFLPRN